MNLGTVIKDLSIFSFSILKWKSLIKYHWVKYIWNTISRWFSEHGTSKILIYWLWTYDDDTRNVYVKCLITALPKMCRICSDCHTTPEQFEQTKENMVNAHKMWCTNSIILVVTASALLDQYLSISGSQATNYIWHW